MDSFVAASYLGEGSEQMQRQKRFPLIELLIVVAVILIIAAIARTATLWACGRMFLALRRDPGSYGPNVDDQYLRITGKACVAP